MARSIENLLKDHGWTDGGSGNFYFGGDHPHLHLHTSKRHQEVENLSEILPEINFMALTFGPGKSTSNITFVEQGEVKTVQGSSRLTFKYEVEKGKANQMIAMINKITGMGLNEV